MFGRNKFTVAFLLFCASWSIIFSQAKPIPYFPTNFNHLITASNSLLSSGKFSAAIKMLEEGIRLAKSPEEKTIYYFNLANAKANKGLLSEALEDYQRCLIYARKANDTEKSKFCEESIRILELYNQAKQFKLKNEDDLAIKYYNEAAELSASINNLILKVKCLRRLSFFYLNERNNTDELFLKYNLEANKIAFEIKNYDELILSFINIGHYYYEHNNLNLAINYFSQALPYINEETNKEDIFTIYYNLAVVYNDIGNFDKSIEYSNQALTLISSDYLNPYYSATLNNLGFSYVKKGLNSGQREDLNHAFDYFTKALEVNEKTGSVRIQVAILNNIGSLKAHLGENLDALYYLNKARSLAETQKLTSYLISIYTNIGIIYSRLGDYQNSTLYYDKAIKLALAENENKTLWESYLEKGNLLKKKADLTNARFYYLNSINIIESLRAGLVSEEDKANFLGTDKRLDAYYNLIDLLIQESQKTRSVRPIQEAFFYLERAKARAFLEQIEAGKLAENFPANIKLINQEKEIMSDMSGLYTKLLAVELSEDERTSILKEIKELEARLENLRRQIRSQNPGYAKLTYPEIIGYQQARKEFIDRKTAVFSYLISRDFSYCFTLSEDGLRVFPVPNQEELRKKIIAYRRMISDADNQDFQLGHELFNILLKPGLTENISKLIIVPDSILGLLPFEALKPSDEPGDWLINHVQICYAPSLSSLRELYRFQNRPPRHKPSKTIFAVGDPYYGEFENNSSPFSSRNIFQDFYNISDIRFYRLKHSTDEINRICRLFPGSTVLEREKASEDLVKSARLADYQILHFAAHGLIDDQKPARSAIILALDKDPGEDGFLQMREILNLKLNSDLVVLSSCQTGLGRFIRGEGLETLSRAFFFAGSSSVLTSLWAINDQVTAQFMERFYLYLKSSETLAAALRKVKVEMIKSNVVSHPYYWASFVLHGNGQIKVYHKNHSKPFIIIALTIIGLVFGTILIARKQKSFKP